MTKDQLIVKQQLKIHRQRRINKANRQTVKELKGMFTAIIRPLNDNKVGLTGDQLKWAQDVYNMIDQLEF